MTTLEDLDRILGELPEVAEGERHGHPTWSVRGKGIAWLRSFSKADLKRFGDQTPPAEPILAINTEDLHQKQGVLAAGIPLEGASDHGVSEALYLSDPDSNGVELYRDRPEDEWPRDPDGRLSMFTRRLDLEGLLREGACATQTDVGTGAIGEGPKDLA